MSNLKIDLAFKLLEVESLVMNSRAMLGQDNLHEFICKSLLAEAKLNELNLLIKSKPEAEYFLAADEVKKDE